MPRHSINIKRKVVRRHCKIKKRACSFFSLSTLGKNYRFIREFLVGKRTGSSTPVSVWKMTPRSTASGVESHGESCRYLGVSDKGKESSMSARSLAATLWEINGGNFEEKESERESVEKMGKEFDAEFVQPHALDQYHSPACEKMDGSEQSGHRRRFSVTSQKLQLTECIATGHDSVGNASSIEVTSSTVAEKLAGVKNRLKDVSNSLTASRELVKVLFKILSQEEKHSSKLTLVSALRIELDRSKLRVEQLIQKQRVTCSEIDALLKQFAAEKVAWKSKEQERIDDAISSIARELEMERKLRKQTKKLNKKLGRELTDTRENLSKAIKEVDGERRAREIWEQACDELTRGIGKDCAAIAQLKRESAEVREEVEKERQMLQLADVLREERVRMKLAEAKYEFEEKNAALERLRREMECSFGNRTTEEDRDGSPNFGANREFADFFEKIQLGSRQNEVRVRHEGEDHDEGEDSSDSELHSIDLNMADNDKNYKCGVACDEAAEGDSRRASVDEVFKGRKSISEKIQWENICLQKKISQGNITVTDEGKSSAVCAEEEETEHHDKLKTHKPSKSLKDHMLSDSIEASRRRSASPTKRPTMPFWKIIAN